MIIAPGLHELARLELAEGVLEVGEGTFSLPDGSVVAPQDVGVGGGLAEELGSLEDLALGLDALVHILDLLVELMRLCGVVNEGRHMRSTVLTMADVEVEVEGQKAVIDPFPYLFMPDFK